MLMCGHRGSFLLTTWVTAVAFHRLTSWLNTWASAFRGLISVRSVWPWAVRPTQVSSPSLMCHGTEGCLVVLHQPCTDLGMVNIVPYGDRMFLNLYLVFPPSSPSAIQVQRRALIVALYAFSIWHSIKDPSRDAVSVTKDWLEGGKAEELL